jgi:hypothetical protein
MSMTPELIHAGRCGTSASTRGSQVLNYFGDREPRVPRIWGSGHSQLHRIRAPQDASQATPAASYSGGPTPAMTCCRTAGEPSGNMLAWSRRAEKLLATFAAVGEYAISTPPAGRQHRGRNLRSRLLLRRARSPSYVALVQVRPVPASAPASCRFRIRRAHSCAYHRIAEARSLALLSSSPSERKPRPASPRLSSNRPGAAYLADDMHPGCARRHRRARHLRGRPKRSFHGGGARHSGDASRDPAQNIHHERWISAAVGVQLVLVRSQQGWVSDAIGSTLP